MATIKTPKKVSRRIPGLYEDYIVRIRGVSSKAGVKSILNQVIDAGAQRALNETEVNSLIRIGKRKMESIYEARGGLNTYKPHLSFSSRDVGI